MNPKQGFDLQYVPCAVCGASSTGFHFSALTCEGCKAFFRRMALRHWGQEGDTEPGTSSTSSPPPHRNSSKRPFVCIDAAKPGQCSITAFDKRCRFCRFQRCLAAGMTLNSQTSAGRRSNARRAEIASEFERLANADGLLEAPVNFRETMRRNKAMASSLSTTITNENSNSNISSGDDCDCDCDCDIAIVKISINDGNALISLGDNSRAEVVKRVSGDFYRQAAMIASGQHGNLPEIEDPIPAITANQQILNEICTSARLLKPVRQLRINCASQMSEMRLWQHVLVSFEARFSFFLNFVKSLPGYKELLVGDRCSLLANAFYPMSIAVESLDYGYYSPETAQQQDNHRFFLLDSNGYRLIMQHFPPVKTAEPHFIKGITSLKKLNLNSIEFTFVISMLFFNADLPILGNVGPVRRTADALRDTLYAVLVQQERNNNSENGDASVRLQQIEDSIRTLRQMTPIAAETLAATLADQPHFIDENPLFAEIFQRIQPQKNL